MNPEIKQKWVEALRSGEYEQTSGVLRNGDAYCCLGVLCDIMDVTWERDTDWSETSWIAKDGIYDYTGVLPVSVVNAADLGSQNPSVRMNDEWTTLSGLNDNGKNFDEIADAIERYL